MATSNKEENPAQPQFEVLPATEEDFEEALQFMLDHFIPNVHVCRVIGYTGREGPRPLTEYLVRHSLESGVSVKCRDKLSGQTLGYRLSAIRQMSEQAEPVNMELGWQEGALMKLIDASIAGLGTLLPTAKKILEFEMLAVKDTHHRQGIANLMIEKDLQIGKEAGCDHVIVAASVARSQKLFRKLGFDILREIRYKDFLVEGKLVFDGDDGYGTTSCILFSKQL